MRYFNIQEGYQYWKLSKEAKTMKSADFFENLLDQHGDSYRSFDWSAEGQRERFQVLCEIGIEPSHAVLDVGCGLGHLRDYMVEKGFIGDYIGIDKSKKIIAAAKQRACGQGSFRKHDILEAMPGCLVDYVVSSGMLNIEEWSNEANMRLLLRRCFEACRIGAAVNMLSNRAASKRADRHYYDPAQMFNEALTLTPRATLRHNYRENDFTLYLYRVANRCIQNTERGAA